MPWIIFLILLGSVMVANALLGFERRRSMTGRRAILLCLIPMAAALLYGGWLAVQNSTHGHADLGPQPFLTYSTGYLLELGLSADNVLMYMVLLRRFNTPPELQGFVMFWGILLALVLRTVLICSGLAVVLRIPAMLYLMGGLLLAASIAMLLEKSEDKGDEGRTARWLRKIMPFHDRYVGRRILIVENGRRKATPLLLVLLLVGFIDVLFALDSIPAIFGITRVPIIVMSSNLFAVIALQWIYFAIVPLMQRLVYLKPALAIILFGLGIKMLLPLLRHAGYHGPVRVSTTWTLAMIGTVLGIAAAASIMRPRTKNE